jgi:hypothetical protein
MQLPSLSELETVESIRDARIVWEKLGQLVEVATDIFNDGMRKKFDDKYLNMVCRPDGCEYYLPGETGYMKNHMFYRNGSPLTDTRDHRYWVITECDCGGLFEYTRVDYDMFMDAIKLNEYDLPYKWNEYNTTHQLAPDDPSFRSLEFPFATFYYH